MLKYRLANKATIVARTRREIILDTFSSLFLERVSVNNGNFKISFSPRLNTIFVNFNYTAICDILYLKK